MRYDVGKTDRLSVMRAQNASDFRPFRRLFLAKYGVGSGYVALRAPYAYAIALLPVGQYGLFFARGCATLPPKLCSGTHSGRGWWDRSDGVGHLGVFAPGFAPRVFAPGCVLAPIQGANSRSVRN